MARILAFDSLYTVKPLRRLYLASVRYLLNLKDPSNKKLILYRLDQDNLLIRDKSNLSGLSTGLHQNKIDALSIQFYRHLEKSSQINKISIKQLPMYQLYTRQIKLKLAGILNCVYRINNLSNECDGNIEIITDYQTESIMREAISFLDLNLEKIYWKNSKILSLIISCNSLIMRLASLVKMTLSRSTLPEEYYQKEVNPSFPTVLLALPRRRPEDFYTTYVEELEKNFNVIFYSHGFFQEPPKGYKLKKIERKKGLLKGAFNLKTLLLSSESYIADTLLIFKYHFNLSRSVDVVDSLFSNKIDVLINRQQTNVIDNYLAIKARQKGVFILGDIFEEIFFCDHAICSSESQNTESVKLALSDNEKIVYRGSNSLIKYRLKSFNEKKGHYLHDLLGVDPEKKIIFYASDPSKEESQRYLTEVFLIDSFSNFEDYILVIKTHTQDTGKITYSSYCDANSPSNIILIGDVRQKLKLASNNFHVFDNFDFNAAIHSSDGFLTMSSSSILQALVLGVKSGIVDKFDNGFYDYLVNYQATMLINSKESLKLFLETEKLDISDKVLSYCGLKNQNEHFDTGEHILRCLVEFNKDNAAKLASR